MNILEQFDTKAMCEKGAWLHLKIPDTDELAYIDGEEKKKPLRIKLKGPESSTWQSFLRRVKKNSEKDKDEGPAETELHDAKLIAKMTLDWENMPGDDGKPRAFEFEAAVEIYRKHSDLRQQALSFIWKRSNFTQGRLTA